MRGKALQGHRGRRAIRHSSEGEKKNRKPEGGGLSPLLRERVLTCGGAYFFDRGGERKEYGISKTINRLRAKNEYAIREGGARKDLITKYHAAKGKKTEGDRRAMASFWLIVMKPKKDKKSLLVRPDGPPESTKCGGKEGSRQINKVACRPLQEEGGKPSN